MTDRATYWELLDSPDYRRLVRINARRLSSDGCTGVPNIYVLACYDHDIAYRTHEDVFGGPLTREQADLRFKWALQHESPLGRLSPMAWWRWQGVRLAGQHAWDTYGGLSADVYRASLGGGAGSP